MYWVYGYGERNNTFPMLPRYKEQRMEVWGASCYSGAGPSWIQNIPPLKDRALSDAYYPFLASPVSSSAFRTHAGAHR